jgi:hypothetical protein
MILAFPMVVGMEFSGSQYIFNMDADINGAGRFRVGCPW